MICTCGAIHPIGVTEELYIHVHVRCREIVPEHNIIYYTTYLRHTSTHLNAKLKNVYSNLTECGSIRNEIASSLILHSH